MQMAVSSPNGLEILWEKEKLLVTSNFSFSHSVFKRLFLQTHKNQGFFWKGLRRCVWAPYCQSMHQILLINIYTFVSFRLFFIFSIKATFSKLFYHRCFEDICFPKTMIFAQYTGTFMRHAYMQIST